MSVIFIIIILIGIVVFYYNSANKDVGTYELKEDEWNPPLPQDIPEYPEGYVAPVQCRCLDCKYFYRGTKTEYNYSGTSETTVYQGLCLRGGGTVDAGELPPPHVVKGCSLYSHR
ncbi:MAG: hypothetical protein IJZ34_10210 [Lachnospiraceae bacterium]|nr:hypothetical protein [Lachnospiraceae bacterium]